MSTIDELLLRGGGQGEGMFMKGLFRSLIQGTKASNAIPGGGDSSGMGAPGMGGVGSSDYSYHAALFPDFSSKAGEASDAVLKLIDKLVKHIDTSSDGLGGLEEASDPTAFEALADLMEDLLDDVESHLRGERLGADANARGQPSTEMVSRIRTVAGAVRQTAKRYESMVSQLLDIPKPQMAFYNEIDNRRETSFIPKPHGKPDFRAPLGGRDCPHPYEVEIRNFGYLPWQLQAPKESEIIASKPKPLEHSKPLLFVDTPDAVAKMVCTIREELDQEMEKAIAIDLEAHSIRSFQGLVCLMQISTRGQDYIVDTLAVRKSISLLADLLSDHTVVKVFHGAESDIKWLQRDFSLYIVNLFDTYVAAKRLAFPAASLAYLLERYCDVKANKAFQLADWRARPLSEEMIRYAREDTHYLLYIHDRLRQELEHQEGKQGLQAVLDGSREVSLIRHVKEVFDPEGYLKLLAGPQGRRATKVLGNTETMVLKALYDWRDKFAREHDESIGYVCPERLLLRLATVMPRTFDSLQECGNPLPSLVTKNGEEVLAVIAAAVPKVNLGTPVVLPTSSSSQPQPIPPTNQPGGGPQVGQMRANVSSFTSFGTYNPMSSGAPPLLPAPATTNTVKPTASSPDQLSTSPVLPTDELFRTAGWTTPLPPPRQGCASSDGATRRGMQGLSTVPALGNEGWETFRVLEHSLDLSEDPLDYDSDDGEMGLGGGGPRIPGFVDPMAAARALLRKEQGLDIGGVGGAVVDLDESDGEGKEEEDDDDDDADLDMPRSMADIYRISNRNRRRNKEKKKMMDASGGEGDGDEGGDEASAESGPTAGGESAAIPAAAVGGAGSDPEIDAYFAGCKRKKHDSDDTVKFMAAIGWIPPNLGNMIPAPQLPPSAHLSSGLPQGGVVAGGGLAPPPLPQQQQLPGGAFNNGRVIGVGGMGAMGGGAGGNGGQGLTPPGGVGYPPPPVPQMAMPNLAEDPQMMMLNPEAALWQGGRGAAGAGGGYNKKEMGGGERGGGRVPSKGFQGQRGGLPPAGPSANLPYNNPYLQAQLMGGGGGGRGGQRGGGAQRGVGGFVDYSNLPASVIQAMSMAYVNPPGQAPPPITANGGGKFNPYMMPPSHQSSSSQQQQQQQQIQMMAMASAQQQNPSGILGGGGGVGGGVGGGQQWQQQQGARGGYGLPSGRR